MPRVRENGLRGGLDAVGLALLGRGKDPEGARLIRALCRPRPGGGYLPLTEGNRPALARYCARDVELLSEIDRLLPPAREPDVVAMDAAINEKGFAFDREAAVAIAKRCQVNAERRLATIGADAADMRSFRRLAGLLAPFGIEIRDMKKATLQSLLESESLPFGAREIIEARIGAAKITLAKLESALARAAWDGRIHGSLIYYGGHTGRWAGAGFQPQNLPRQGKLDVAEARARVLAGGAAGDEECGQLVRSCVVPDRAWLTVADLSAIEARVLAWVAGEGDVLAQFRESDREGKRVADIYQRMAALVFGVSDPLLVSPVQRFVGKALVLGCGYQMGETRFAAQAELSGIDLASLGLSARQCVNAFRAARWRLAGTATGKEWEGRPMTNGGLWKDLGRAVKGVVESGIPATCGRTHWRMVGPHLIADLPSGRWLVYRDARIEPRIPAWGGEPRPTICYEHRGARTGTYGGKLAENIVQALSRDILVGAMLRIGADRIRLHIHDEVVVEGRALADVLAELRRAPAWAPDLPLNAEGIECRFYQKP